MRVVLDSNVLARATPGKTSAAREVLLLLTICTRDRHLLHPSTQRACAGYGLRIINEVDLLSELRSATPQTGVP